MRYHIILLVLLLLPLAQGAISKPAITVKLERYDPVPVQPGDVFDAWVGITNKGTSAQNMKIRLLDAFPFSSETDTVDVGGVPENEKVLAHFIIKVDPVAINKNYNITFEYQWGDAENWWTQSTDLVQVRVTDAAVSVKGYEVSEKEIVPGSPATIVITLENTGRTAVKDIDVKLDLKDKFSPVGTSTTQRLAFLKPGETQAVTYPVIADPAAEPKVYSLPVEISFMDERNNKYTRTTTISAAVNAKPDLLIIVDSVTPDEKGTKVTLKAINKGIANIKYLTLQLLPGDYDLQSTGETQYLGNVDSDDFELVDYVIVPRGASMSLPVEATFKDPYNKEFTMRSTLRITTEQETQAGFPSWQVATALLAVIVLALLFWRRKR